MNILILRGGALGDLILTLPVLREIRENYPNSDVELLGVFPQARLAAPEFVNRAERLEALELAPLFVHGSLPDTLRNRLSRFDLAINFLPDPDSVIAQNLTATGAKKVIACSPKTRLEGHAVYRLAEVLAPLGLSLRDPVPRLAIGEKRANSSTLGFHVGSGSPQKNWPINHWIQLIQRLDDLFGDFLLVGGEADEKVVRKFCADCHIRRFRTLLNVSLTELSKALRECDVFVGHDTGVTHLAAAVGTPTVALYGPTNPNVWAPLGEHVQIVSAMDGKMESIAVQAVAAVVTAKTTAPVNGPLFKPLSGDSSGSREFGG